MSRHRLQSSQRIYFPNLSHENHRITSEASGEYNCFAWVLGETMRRWDPVRPNYWPPGVSRDATDVGSFIAAFATERFVVCADSTLEDGVEKIAIYVHPTEGPSHSALQLADGSWSSKLGDFEDIGHHSEHDLEGTFPQCYGEVHTYMQRPRVT